MGKLSDSITSGIKSRPFAVTLEKSHVSGSGGRAKVLFSTNKKGLEEKEYLRDEHSVEKAFTDLLGHDARIVTKSICPAEKGLYYGMVVANQQSITLEEANKEGSGYHIVAANMFADDNDDIWTLSELSEGESKVLVRSSTDDLKDILNTRMNSEMSLASSGQSVSDSFNVGSFVRFIGPKEKVYNGFAVDTQTVFSAETASFLGADSISSIAFTPSDITVQHGITKAVGNDVATYQELSRAQIKSLREYLTTLYSHAPDFLQNYLNAINNHASV